jgi:azurin
MEHPQELVGALSNENMFWRMTAQRLLLERGQDDVGPELYRLINEQGTDGQGLNAGALHAIWTLNGLGLIPTNAEATAVVRGALFHPSAAVRKAAIAVLPRSAEVDNALILSDALQDKDAGVQLQALLYFSERSASDEIGRILYNLSQDSQLTGDIWLSQALYIAASRHTPGFISAFLEEHPTYVAQVDEGSMSEEAGLNGGELAETFVRAYIGQLGTMEEPGLIDDGEGTTITIRTVVNEMKYDVTEFVVQAGKPVELVFENTDFMQHNLVIVSPGTKEKVGMEADQLAMDPQGAEMNYVPDMPEVLYATAIIDPENKVVLKFKAPDKAGNYPFICTFPGHWRIMQGVMKVVAN